jgi:hypothetical protein
MALHASSFLSGAELGRLAACSAYWGGLLLGDGARWLWREALQHEVCNEKRACRQTPPGVLIH